MGVYHKRGTWWIDWYEGGRRLRKKTRARNKSEARKLLEQVRAKQLPRDLGLFDPKLKCAELVTRYLEALKGTRTATRERHRHDGLHHPQMQPLRRRARRPLPDATARAGDWSAGTRRGSRPVHTLSTTLEARARTW